MESFCWIGLATRTPLGATEPSCRFELDGVSRKLMFGCSLAVPVINSTHYLRPGAWFMSIEQSVPQSVVSAQATGGGQYGRRKYVAIAPFLRANGIGAPQNPRSLVYRFLNHLFFLLLLLVRFLPFSAVGLVYAGCFQFRGNQRIVATEFVFFEGACLYA